MTASIKMTKEILKELPVHLQVVKETKVNIPFLILSGLVDSEDDLIWRNTDPKTRITNWWKRLVNSNTHFGDCVNECNACTLCQVLDTIDQTKDMLEQCQVKLDEEDNIRGIIEIILGTQPQQKFSSLSAMRDHVKTFPSKERGQKYQEIYDYEDDIIKRKELWMAKQAKEDKSAVITLTSELLELGQSLQ